MKVCVLGLWHLGSVISACIASKNHFVIGIDENLANIKNLNKNKAPIFEPGLNELIKKGLKSKNLIFTNDKKKANIAEILWVAFDTPVDANDTADVFSVEEQVKKIMPHLKKNVVILFSSQLPVGTIKKIQKYSEKKFPKKKFKFACSPENLRLGNALNIFLNPDRVIIGIDDQKTKRILSLLFKPITDKILWIKIASAEMAKHTINSFLATSIIFANEIASICEKVGANYLEVEKSIKSDNRVGQKAYLSAGKPIAGGTLLRDVNFLNDKRKKFNLLLPLLSSIIKSNNKHKKWVTKKLLREFKTLSNISITVWGLTYKPYTNSLRRSLSVELCNWLIKQNAKIHVYDPVVKNLPKHWDGKVNKYSNPLDSIKNSDVLIIGTFWPEFKKFTNKIKRIAKKKLIVIDPDNDLKIKTLKSNLKYIRFGIN
jgi:UDPglucose 6-dehydrogenase